MNGWVERLLDGASRLGLELSGQQTEALINYLELLIKWNARVNLVGPGGAEQWIERHLLDCLAVGPHVPASCQRLLDVGAGAGLPSIPLSILRPDVVVTALEPIHKKTAFLAAVRRELMLENLRPLTTRVEQHQGSPEFVRYDVAVSRAAFALEEWFSMARDLVSAGGLVLGMEGAVQATLPPGATRSPYSIGADRSRAIIAWVPEPARA